MRRFTLLCLSFLMAQGCVSVAGRIRPLWNGSWSQVAQEPVRSSARSETVRVVLRGPDGKLPLAGATVIAMDGAGHRTVAIADPDGVASFDLAPGTVSIETAAAGFATHRCAVNVQPGEVTVVHVFAALTVNEIAACCGG